MVQQKNDEQKLQHEIEGTHMARELRLGITLSDEDAKVFWKNEETYIVTPEQKLQLREAQRIYQSHPILF